VAGKSKRQIRKKNKKKKGEQNQKKQTRLSLKPAKKLLYNMCVYVRRMRGGDGETTTAAGRLKEASWWRRDVHPKAR